jgi:hypothetical protein
VSTTAGGFTEMPEDGFYAAAFTNNASGTTLTGDNTYSITFTQPQSSYTYSQLPASGIIPPLVKNPDGSVTGFWSVTAYQPDNSESAAPFLSQAAVLNTAYSKAESNNGGNEIFAVIGFTNPAAFSGIYTCCSSMRGDG